jgi:hypothetical protein
MFVPLALCTNVFVNPTDGGWPHLKRGSDAVPIDDLCRCKAFSVLIVPPLGPIATLLFIYYIFDCVHIFIGISVLQCR